MDQSQQSSAGFSSHVQGQLLDIAAQSRRSHGQNRRGRGSFQPANHLFQAAPPVQHANMPQYSQHMNSQSWANQIIADPKDTVSFPPLSSPRPQSPARQQNHVTYTQPQMPLLYSQPLPPSQSSNLAQYSQVQEQDYRGRGRGGPFRGRGRGSYNTPGNQTQSHNIVEVPGRNPDSFHRPSPTRRKLFTSGTHPHFRSVEDQRAFQQRIIDQSDFLNHLANKSLRHQLTTEEQQSKECFRKELESIAQSVIAQALTDDTKLRPEHIQLKLYGSLGSGFAVAGSDMDLLLAFPQDEVPLGNIEIESRRLLEKALLDAGIGARLLTNTRVPILRVCQKPSSELLKNLRDARLKWDESLNDKLPPTVDEGFGTLPILNDSQIATAVAALENFEMDAHNIPLPPSPISEQAKLEYVGNCGIQCDINFSNYVALHNTRLLKTYGMCDPRVRQVGVFVKSWAKARDINTPYRGTLSSYGYILMVLHYLMDVVNPPIIPNLQDLAKQKDSWEGKTDVELVEGFDVRFIRDMNEVQAIMKDMPRNHESVGALLRGFFWYYADPRGFHWNYDVISIRSRSGRLTKRSKGWTEAKWTGENHNIRLRYLLAIEDPFEVEHNVGRTVGHSGIVAIRDEFRRAWTTIENIQFDGEARLWFSVTQDGQKLSGDEMIAVAENRGDLLRKDQDYHRQKARQMRQDLEAKEKMLRDAAVQESEDLEESEMNGTFEVSPHSDAQTREPYVAPQLKTLINDGNPQVKQRRQKRSKTSVMQDDAGEKLEPEVGEPILTVIDWSEPFTDTEIKPNTEVIGNPISKVEGFESNGPPLYQPVDHQITKPSTDSNVSLSEMPIQDETLDVMIGWDFRTQGGKWLLWRDQRIRSGKWRPYLGSIFRKLDEAFPYDPNMTVTDLAEKNKTLRSLYLNSYTPQKQFLQQYGPNDSLKSDCRTEMSANRPTSANDSLPSSNRCQPSDAKRGRTGSERSATMDENLPQFQRGKWASRQGNHTAQRIKGADQDYNISPTKAKGNRLIPTSVLPQSLNHTDEIQLPSLSPSRTQSVPRDHASVAHFAIPSQISSKSLSVEGHVQSGPIHNEPARFHIEAELGAQEHTKSPIESAASYPAMQGPSIPRSHLPSHQRLRNEDSRTTPIPWSSGFQFDPRQLADLDIIRRGGNACARRGEEFEIEEDYEFGGGGVMAMGSSTVGRESSHNIGRVQW